MRQQLIKLRKITGLNQADFAKKVGTVKQRISNMETGIAPVTFETLLKYAKVFNRYYPIILRKIPKKTT